MAKFKKVTSVLLAVLMVFGSMSVLASASRSDYLDEAIINQYNSIDKAELTTEQQATLILDELDVMLTKEDIVLDIPLIGTIDLTSVDAAMDSIYNLTGNWLYGSLTVGDLFVLEDHRSDIATNRRASANNGDMAVIDSLVTYLANCAPTLLGMFGDDFNWGIVHGFLPPEFRMIIDDFNGWLDELIWDLLHPVNDEVMTGNPTLDDFVQFLCDNQLAGLRPEVMGFEGVMPGFIVDVDGDTAYRVIEEGIYEALNAFIVPILNSSLKTVIREAVESNQADGGELYELIDTNYVIEKHTFDTTLGLVDQLNDVLGVVVEEMLLDDKSEWVSTADGITAGRSNAENLTRNLEVLIRQIIVAGGDTEPVNDYTLEKLGDYIARAAVEQFVDHLDFEVGDTMEKIAYEGLRELVVRFVPEVTYLDLETDDEQQYRDGILEMGADIACYYLNANLGLDCAYSTTANEFILAFLDWCMPYIDGLFAKTTEYNNAIADGDGWGAVDAILWQFIPKAWFNYAGMFANNGVTGTADDLTFKSLLDYIMDALLDLDVNKIFTFFTHDANSDLTKHVDEFIIQFVANILNTALSPVAVDSKTVELVDENGNCILTLYAPYMTDANGAVSNAVELTVSDIKNGSFTLTTSVDAEWLADSEREYPVTIDPIMQTEQTWDEPTHSHSAFIASYKPNNRYGRGGADYEGSMYVGFEPSYGKTRALVQNPTLPTLAVADKVVHAELAVFTYSCYPEIRVDLHRITENWNQATVCWNSNIDYDPQIEDYQIVQNFEYYDEEADRWQRFEITDLVRGWYSGEYENHGVMLTSESETASTLKRAWFLSSGYPEYSEIRPMLIIAYRNMSGYENYWSYTNLAAGRNGVVSVNNFNGNLVFTQPVTNDNGGNLLPVGISLVYNSNAEAPRTTDFGTNMQTNFHITLYREWNDENLLDYGYRYCMTDADGTKHWFQFEDESATTAQDEDGLGYTIDLYPEEAGAWISVEDKDGNRMLFNDNLNLTTIKDTNGNVISLSYDTVAGRQWLYRITDGAGRAYTFTYNMSSGLCTAITDPAGIKTAFSYTTYANAAYLTGITFQSGTADAKTVNLTHSNGKLTAVTAIDSTRAKISYSTADNNRVANINWGISDSQLLESYTFAYKQNETKVADLQNRTYTYQFNDFGQTTGIVSDEDQTAKFYDWAPGNTTDARANKLLSESKVIHSVANLVKNGSFTGSLAGWGVVPASGSAEGKGEIDSSLGYLTKNALKFTKQASRTNGVYAVGSVFGIESGLYTASAYLNTGGQTLGGSGASLKVRLLNNGTVVEIPQSECITQTDGWERISVTFEVPTGCTVQLVPGLEADAVGTVWFDELQVEQGAGVSSFNMVENAALNNSNYKWESYSIGNNTALALTGYDRYLSLAGVASSDSTNLGQSIQTVNGEKGDVFSFGSWVKANSAPVNEIREDDSCKPEFSIVLRFYDANGTSVGEEEVKVNSDLAAWQYVAGKAIAPAAYTSVRFEVVYHHNVNTLYAVGSFVYKEEFGQTFVYNNNGDPVSAVDLAASESSFAFNGNQMAALVNPSGSAYYYSYDEDTNNLTTAVSTDGQRYTFAYDSKGNVTNAVVQADKPATAITAGTKYVIRNAESGNCLDIDADYFICNNRFEADKQAQIWQAVSAGQTDVYRLTTYDANLKVQSGLNEENRPLVIDYGTGTAFSFKIVPSEAVAGAFNILTKTSSYARAVDGQPEDSKDYEDGTLIKQTTLDTDDKSQCWFFYPVTEDVGQTIETAATYTANGNFVSTVSDQRGNNTTYSYNQNTGTLTSVADAKSSTSYTYNTDNSLASVRSVGYTVEYTYAEDRLTDINTDDSVYYKFQYDTFGRSTAVQVGNNASYQTLAQYTYNTTGLLSTLTYGNSWKVNYVYDSLDRVTQVNYNNSSTQKLEYLYGSDGNVAQIIDYAAGTRTKPVYDLAGRLVAVKQYDGTAQTDTDILTEFTYTYADKTNYLTKKTMDLPTRDLTATYTYGDAAAGEMPDQVYNIYYDSWSSVDYAYDSLGRLTDETVNVALGYTIDNSYTYLDVNADRTTTLVSTYTTKTGTYSYTYDNVGNITQIVFTPSDTTQSAKTITYQYDMLNRLVRENNQFAGKTYFYNYSSLGNLSSVQEGSFTLSGTPSDLVRTEYYYYDNATWRDLLTGYNNKNITYDAIGNPTSIGTANLTWQGRTLTQYADGANTYSYEYDMSGHRISKTVNGTKTEYFYDGDQLVAQKSGNNRITFMFDANGSAFGFYYNNAPYFFIKNIQGDVTAITNFAGTVIGTYTYDAWGNLIESASDLSDEVAAMNPIRYRGYYYDAETGYYFLNSRYYDAEMGRFLNADSVDVITATLDALTDKNLYSYCDNNPVVRIDRSGEFWNYVIGGAVGAIVGGVSAAISGGDWRSIALGAGVGAGGGLLAASGLPVAVQIVASGLLSGGNNLVSQTLIEGKSFAEVNWIDVGIDTAIGVGTSVLSYGITRNATQAADKIIQKGANKVVKGQQSLLSGSRYGKGAIKRGTEIMNNGIKQMNTARGTSSVLGSIAGGILTSIKSLINLLIN